jgi:hypothetical protein
MSQDNQRFSNIFKYKLISFNDISLESERRFEKRRKAKAQKQITVDLLNDFEDLSIQDNR